MRRWREVAECEWIIEINAAVETTTASIFFVPPHCLCRNVVASVSSTAVAAMMTRMSTRIIMAIMTSMTAMMEPRRSPVGAIIHLRYYWQQLPQFHNHRRGGHSSALLCIGLNQGGRGEPSSENSKFDGGGVDFWRGGEIIKSI